MGDWLIGSLPLRRQHHKGGRNLRDSPLFIICNPAFQPFPHCARVRNQRFSGQERSSDGTQKIFNYNSFPTE